MASRAPTFKAASPAGSGGMPRIDRGRDGAATAAQPQLRSIRLSATVSATDSTMLARQPDVRIFIGIRVAPFVSGDRGPAMVKVR